MHIYYCEIDGKGCMHAWLMQTELLVMPWCACASEVYGSVSVCVCMCVCVSVSV